MNKHAISAGVLTLSGLLTCGGALAAQELGGAELVVHVTGVERDEGSVRVAVFDRAEAFPGEPLLAGIVTPLGGEALWSAAVRPGSYAVAVVHDADGNGRLNTNFLGMPRERYGFSNDARGAFGPPSFEEASFAVGADTVRISVRVR